MKRGSHVCQNCAYWVQEVSGLPLKASHHGLCGCHWGVLMNSSPPIAECFRRLASEHCKEWTGRKWLTPQQIRVRVEWQVGKMDKEGRWGRTRLLKRVRVLDAAVKELVGLQNRICGPSTAEMIKSVVDCFYLTERRKALFRRLKLKWSGPQYFTLLPGTFSKEKAGTEGKAGKGGGRER